MFWKWVSGLVVLGAIIAIYGIFLFRELAGLFAPAVLSEAERMGHIYTARGVGIIAVFVLVCAGIWLFGVTRNEAKKAAER